MPSTRTRRPAGAVQGETFDAANTYSFVAISLYYDAAGLPLWRCSGTMISPTAYVTAGHCTGLDEGATPAHAELWFTPAFTPADFGNYPFRRQFVRRLHRLSLPGRRRRHAVSESRLDG